MSLRPPSSIIGSTMSAPAGWFKTPTLLNADFNAPYFHDGRYDSYDQVVAHFDRVFDLGLSPRDRQRSRRLSHRRRRRRRAPMSATGSPRELKEINDFASVLDTAIPARDTASSALTVDTVGLELRELTEDFPDRNDATVTGGMRGTRVGAHGAQGAGVGAAPARHGRLRCGHSTPPPPSTTIFRKLMASAVPCCLPTRSPGRCSTRRSTTLITGRCGRCCRRRKARRTERPAGSRGRHKMFSNLQPR